MSRLLQINEIVGQPVAKKSKAANLSQQEVADRTNLNTEGIGPIQRGVKPLRLSSLLKLATLFRCGIDKLLSESSTGLTGQAQCMTSIQLVFPK